MKRGSIVFVHGSGFVSTCIRIGQKIEAGFPNWDFDTPTHVEFCMGGSTAMSAEASGVQRMPIDRHEDIEVFEPITEYRVVQQWVDEATALMLSAEHTGYDFRGLLTFLYRPFQKLFNLKPIRPDWKLANFCSELIMKTFELTQHGLQILKLEENSSTYSPEESRILIDNCKYFRKRRA